MKYYFLLIVNFLFLGCNALITDENEGIQFLNYYEVLAADQYYRNVLASWKYYTNLTSHNLEVMTASSLEFSAFSKEAAQNASKYDWKNFQNETVKRLFEKISSLGFSAVNDTEKLRLISNLEASLTNMYSTGKVCNIPGESTCLELEPGLTDILANSRDEAKLRAVWTGFRDATGKKMRSQYEQFVNVMNEAIKFSGFKDTGEYWRSWYEVPTFESDVRNLYNELSELYQHLHYYVRQKLRNKYNADVFPETGHLPAHLLGNMWAQQWNNIYDLVIPYPSAGRVNITKAMLDKGYNITYMYQVAEDFFKSIGLQPMPERFWTESMLEKPADRDVVCHASAWDFYNKQDFRIKQCTSITEDQLMTVHHEMGHVIYFLEYMNQPIIFRRGANPGFHEGMADIVTLSFQTPEHLIKLGLVDSVPGPNDTDADINFLLRMALEKVAFLPFGYLIDQWRWSVFKGETTPNKYNQKWWELRCEIQGISPPVNLYRDEEYFDPGAKYHIPGNTPYIRYFVSYILQFMWHKSLCDVAGHTGPLHRCDIYQNRAAGEKLREMLQLGSSKHWSEALFTVTGSRTMSAAPLIEYFQPLLQWLKKQNGNADVSWNKACPQNEPPSSAAIIKISVSLTFISLIFVFLF